MAQMDQSPRSEAFTPPSAREFCEILASARNYKLLGVWSGSAFRQHPVGVFRSGIILCNEWTTRDSCHADVLLDPTSPLAPRCEDPAVYGDPFAKPLRGGALRVFKDGAWSPDDGPWRRKIVEILSDLKSEIEAARIAFSAAAEAKAAKDRAAREAVVAAARKAMEAA